MSNDYKIVAMFLYNRETKEGVFYHYSQNDKDFDRYSFRDGLRMSSGDKYENFTIEFAKVIRSSFDELAYDDRGEFVVDGELVSDRYIWSYSE